MQAITSVRGKKTPKSRFSLDSYLSRIYSLIQTTLNEKTSTIFDSVFRFLTNNNLSTAILACDMESTSSDFLINTFATHANKFDFPYCLLKLTSKFSTKNQILKLLNDSLSAKGGIVYIESFEEWDSETLCFVFEYLCDFQGKISFVIDISTDPRGISLLLDTDILQKLTVGHFSFPDFSQFSGEILYELSLQENFPVISQELFGILHGSRSDVFFLKTLKSSLLEFFASNPDRNIMFLHGKNLEELVRTKRSWNEYLEKLFVMTEATPVNMGLRMHELYATVYKAEDVNECCYLKDLFGKFKTKEFDDEEVWKMYLSELCKESAIGEEDLKSLWEVYENTPLVYSSASKEKNPKIHKWKDMFVLPLFRNKIIRFLKPLPENFKPLKNYEKYVLGPCEYLDTDILTRIIEQLGDYKPGEMTDVFLLFTLIKNKGKCIDLNSVFNEYVKNVGTKESKKILQ